MPHAARTSRMRTNPSPSPVPKLHPDGQGRPRGVHKRIRITANGSRHTFTSIIFTPITDLHQSSSPVPQLHPDRHGQPRCVHRLADLGRAPVPLRHLWLGWGRVGWAPRRVGEVGRGPRGGEGAGAGWWRAAGPWWGGRRNGVDGAGAGREAGRGGGGGLPRVAYAASPTSVARQRRSGTWREGAPAPGGFGGMWAGFGRGGRK
jgi:hypothetical protein